MRKHLIVMLIVLSLAALTACGSEQSNVKKDKTVKDKEKTTESSKKEGSVEVNKGLFNVEITLPASFFEGEDIDQVITKAKADGVNEVIKNADGSLTYKMSKSQHKKMMAEMESSILNTIQETKTSGDFVSIKDIRNNKSFSEFTIVVNKAAFENSLDSFASLGLGITGMFYQVFSGIKAEDCKVTVNYMDQVDSKIFNTVVFPDDLKD